MPLGIELEDKSCINNDNADECMNHNIPHQSVAFSSSFRVCNLQLLILLPRRQDATLDNL